VATATSTSEALARIASRRPDILLSDIAMPGDDGYELIRRVKALPSGQAIRAAALSAYARTEDRLKALWAGFETHIPKPVQPNELAAVVASLAGRTGQPMAVQHADRQGESSSRSPKSRAPTVTSPATSRRAASRPPS